ncbi:hypothetical protein QUB33_25605 [Microcoleus sp. B3-A4]|uniref:hypothetical protein n=1 Tax=Microcoleus sp. B3-A4 TaxID=2818653 RepID=UPI002FD565A8
MQSARLGRRSVDRTKVLISLAIDHGNQAFILRCLSRLPLQQIYNLSITVGLTVMTLLSVFVQPVGGSLDI